MDDKHCVDCCCAKSWKALGISEYTGKHIAEHIEELKRKADLAQSLADALEIARDLLAQELYENGKTITEIDAALRAFKGESPHNEE